jgi:hypothetical protein
MAEAYYFSFAGTKEEIESPLLVRPILYSGCYIISVEKNKVYIGADHPQKIFECGRQIQNVLKVNNCP